MFYFELFLSLTLITILPSATPCPSQEKILPCSCSSHANPIITCPDLENEQSLLNAVYELRNMKKFYSFVIKNGNFMFIPHNIFKEVKFQELEIHSTSFMALTDTDVAFEGLEENLVSLVITDSNMLNDWDWMVLRNLKTLLKLHVDVDMSIISKDIRKISSRSMKDVSFANNKITYIDDEALSGFEELLSISLKNNLISDVKRSMMPNPATLLWKLDLSYNQIQQLSADLFENMPSLEFLFLDSNKILTLNEKTFKQVWENLRHFEVMDNLLRCDCRLEWMLALKFPSTTKGICDQPNKLKGTKLQDLTSKDILC